jgi:regulator of sigma E protease
MTILIKILQLLLSLSILVIIHELGHFIMAKIFKTRVEKFYLFFDPWFSLFKMRKGETEYGVGWLPLGGYVKIAGMIDESLDKEQMKQPVQPWEFRAKEPWKRLLIMTGGVLFNFILALLIYVLVLYAWGETYLPTSNVKYGILTDSTGYSIGLRNGDKILSVDNQQVENFNAIMNDIILNNRKTIQVDRNGEKLDIQLPADYVPGLLKGKGMIDLRTPYAPFVVLKCIRETPADSAGILPGDEVKGVDGISFTYYDEFQKYISGNKGKRVILNILRKGETLNLSMVPNKDGKVGIAPKKTLDMYFDLKTIRYGFLESVPAGIRKGFKTVSDYLKQFKLIFSRRTKGYESLGGFITIGSIFPAEWDWPRFWDVTAFLSIILAVMNILPIPALDGGHVMFTLFELITGRKPSDKFMEYAQIAGMIFLLALLIYANGNDIIRAIKKL